MKGGSRLGQIDIMTHKYMSDNGRFADAFNYEKQVSKKSRENKKNKRYKIF